MGVPSLFAWVRQICPGYVKRLPPKIQGEEKREKNETGEEYDNLYIDFNGIIHQCSHSEKEEEATSEEEIMERIFKAMDRYVNYVRPRKMIFIGVDGVCPVAKIIQQRKRRYCSVLNNTGGFDSNCITPGTKFMEKIGIALHGYIVNRMDNDLYWSGLKVILSDSKVAGEGEHKIYEFIRKEIKKNERFKEERHCIYGMDGDLIILTLGINIRNMTILREEQEIIKKNNKCDICGKKHKTKDHGKETKLIMCYPNELRKWLINEAKKNLIETKKEEGEEYKEEDIEIIEEEIIKDFILISFLVGNDFLPRIPSIKIQTGGMEMLLKNYWKLYVKGKRLSKGTEINITNFKELFKMIGEEESNILKGIIQNTKKDKEVKEYDQNIYFDSSKEIKLNKEGYHDRYYQIHFNTTNIEFIQNIVHHYFEGISWVFNYYLNTLPSWRWYYKFHYAPFALDFALYLNENDSISFSSDTPILPLEQLLAVLPPQSFINLPSKLAHFVLSPTSPILHYFNTSFKIDINGENKLYKGVPLLPDIDINLLHSFVFNLEHSLPPSELKRNILLPFNILYVTKNSSLPLFSKIQSLYPSNSSLIFSLNSSLSSSLNSSLNSSLISSLSSLPSLPFISSSFSLSLFPLFNLDFFISPKLHYLMFSNHSIITLTNRHVSNAFFSN
ncbi:5'-3' exonuclease domain containing protein [Entamoeba histolytica HM-3:IMSS]|uniref:5'-3' exonuclease domain containing protein n=1 Tax=Entamoeba histolytica HM-3:IMSS TaxID=885315 RepID=M7X5K7_ENTHI|nr:5'-3' exonuclease domain containing protein [Entamoeba histolytica HM-3:IMSS]